MKCLIQQFCKLRILQNKNPPRKNIIKMKKGTLKIIPEMQAETKLIMRATTLTVSWNWTNF